MAKKKSGRSKRRERALQKEKQKRQNSIFRFVLSGVLIAGIAGFMLWPKPQASEVSAERISLNPTIGATEAEVVITEFGDFGCHGCQAWHNAGIKDRILETYGDKVQFVWQDYPVITARSPKAAEAGQCALDQGMFWEFHDAVYEGHEGLSEDALKHYAESLNLNMQAFNNCFDSGQHRATVEHDLNEGRQLRLRATPSFAVNGQLLPAPPGYDQLAAIIENELRN